MSSDLDPSFQNWDLHYDEGLSQFETKDICYLVAESPNVLEDVKPGVLYVIGGLVDHNHHKVSSKLLSQMLRDLPIIMTFEYLRWALFGR